MTGSMGRQQEGMTTIENFSGISADKNESYRAEGTSCNQIRRWRKTRPKL